MKAVRVFFTKDGPAVYISHLDLVRTLQRALRRAGLPVWYTEGFSPHMRLSFPFALSLGCAGLREFFETRLTDDDFSEREFAERLNAELPEGLRVVGCAAPELSTDAVCWANYSLTLSSPDCAPEELCERLAAFLSRESIPVMKKGKGGERELELAGLFAVRALEQKEGAALLSLRCRCGSETSLNPALLLSAFSAACPLREERSCREELLTGELTPFR